MERREIECPHCGARIVLSDALWRSDGGSPPSMAQEPPQPARGPQSPPSPLSEPPRSPPGETVGLGQPEGRRPPQGPLAPELGHVGGSLHHHGEPESALPPNVAPAAMAPAAMAPGAPEPQFTRKRPPAPEMPPAPERPPAPEMPEMPEMPDAVHSASGISEDDRRRLVTEDARRRRGLSPLHLDAPDSGADKGESSQAKALELLEKLTEKLDEVLEIVKELKERPEGAKLR